MVVYKAIDDPAIMLTESRYGELDEKRILIAEAMEYALNARERGVIEDYLDGRKIAYTSRRLGRSYERTRQIRREAMEKIRKYIDQDDPLLE